MQGSFFKYKLFSYYDAAASATVYINVSSPRMGIKYLLWIANMKENNWALELMIYHFLFCILVVFCFFPQLWGSLQKKQLPTSDNMKSSCSSYLLFCLPGVFKLTSSIWKTSLIFPIVFQTKFPQLVEDALISCYVTELSSILCKTDNMLYFSSLFFKFTDKKLNTTPDTCNRPRNEIIIS